MKDDEMNEKQKEEQMMEQEPVDPFAPMNQCDSQCYQF